jgi:hypothetical protein
MMPYVQTHGKIIEGRPGSQIDPDLELFRVPDRDAVLSGCLTLRQRVVSSVLRFGANPPPSKILPVELPIPPWPLGVPTLKNWTISPVVQAFVDYAHEVEPSLDVNSVTTGSAGTPELLDRKANSHRSQTLQSR